MSYVAPSTVSTLQTYTSAAHNIIVNDVIDHESRINTVVNTQYPFRNVLINGDMQIAQRGTSSAGITSGGYYTADRWYSNIGTCGTWTQAVSADAPTGSGFRNSLRVTCTTALTALSAGSNFDVYQALEGQTLQHIKKGTASAQQLTLSFWVKGNKTGASNTYIVWLADMDNTRSVGASYTISASDTWEQKTVTFPADATGVFDNDNAASLRLRFHLAAGTTYTSGTLNTTWAAQVDANTAVGQTNLASATSNYWAITGVQLEPGAVASPFEFVRYDDSLRRCQRYYQGVAFTATAVTTGEMGGAVFRVPMRSAPSGGFTLYPTMDGAGSANNLFKPGTGNVSVGAGTAANFANTGCTSIYCTGLSAGGVYSGSFAISAEL